jgi:hypothetical protein
VRSNGGATQVREFDILTCANGQVLNGTATALTSSTICPGSTISSIQRPFAEIDYKTSGGDDSYNAMQLSLTRRSTHGLTLNGQYTLGKSVGTTGGSNEAATAGNNARAVCCDPITSFEYERGYNNFDVRHTFNLSALYTIPGTGAWKGGWSLGGILNARSGLPVPVLIGRSDIVYVDAAGAVWNNAAADRTAVINVPGGNSSRGTERPDLIPGVNPFIVDGGRVFLNPAAFATPKPGTYGNLERNSIHGPNFRDRHGLREAVCQDQWGGRRVPRRGLQPVQHRQLRAAAGDASQRAARLRRDCDPGEPRSARTTVHRDLRWFLGNLELERLLDDRPRHKPAGAARLPIELLIGKGRSQ